jgi:hypothetical protein
MRTESVRPLETDSLRVPDVSTLISYLRRARIALKRTIQRGSGGRGQVEDDMGLSLGI